MNIEDARIALVTAPDIDTARCLAAEVLQRRLAACVNLAAGIESYYWWEGKQDSAKEVLLMIKTSQAAAKELEELILTRHPYDTPEFVLLPVSGVNARYLLWWGTSMNRGECPVA